MGLVQSDGITTADLATLQYGGIDPNVGPVVLGRCAQDTCIPREIALRESGHHAAAAGTSDAQTNGIPIARICPIQASSTKSFSPFAVSTTIFGRNRRTSKRPGGYSSRSRSSVAVVSR
jgi:hypothetical protein